MTDVGVYIHSHIVSFFLFIFSYFIPRNTAFGCCTPYPVVTYTGVPTNLKHGIVRVDFNEVEGVGNDHAITTLIIEIICFQHELHTVEHMTGSFIGSFPFSLSFKLPFFSFAQFFLLSIYRNTNQEKR
jgi:hypothetical protein